MRVLWSMQSGHLQRLGGTGTLVLIDTPPGLDLVLDLYEWQAGGRFAGVSELPAGVHLCVVKLRHGLVGQHFWVLMEAGGVRAWKWMAEEEQFVPLARDDEGRLADSVRRGEWNERLGRYEMGEVERWRRYTRHLSFMPGDVARPGPFKRRSHDRSAELEAMTKDGVNVLGWLEALFAEFSLAHMVSSFELWRDMVLLCCCCIEAIRQKTGFFEEFYDTLSWQLDEAGAELMWREPGDRNALLAGVTELVRDVKSDPDLPGSLKSAARQLESMMPGGQEESEQDDDGPMVVEL